MMWSAPALSQTASFSTSGHDVIGVGTRLFFVCLLFVFCFLAIVFNDQRLETCPQRPKGHWDVNLILCISLYIDRSVFAIRSRGGRLNHEATVAVHCNLWMTLKHISNDKRLLWLKLHFQLHFLISATPKTIATQNYHLIVRGHNFTLALCTVLKLLSNVNDSSLVGAYDKRAKRYC